MNEKFISCIAELKDKDWDGRIEVMNHEKMVEYLNEIGEASGEPFGFADCEVPDDPSALYLLAYDSTHESRCFCTASYMDENLAFRDSVDYAYRK